MHYIVAYDVCSDRRRQKVVNTLKDYGLRVQYSVFDCDLKRQDLAELRTRLRAAINQKTDRLHFYPLCENCYYQGERYGRGDVILDDNL